MCSYPAYTRLAEILARSGFDVLRFDYHGTGDSAGTDSDPDRVPAWLESIACAVREVRRLANVERVSLVGVRLGATLAACAGARMGGIESLVMWAPCATGKSFVREMRAADASRGVDMETVHDGSLEALGQRFTAQTLHDLQALDAQHLKRAPARRVLVIGRDDMPARSPLPAAYRGLGVDASFEVLSGYRSMMVEPHHSVLVPHSLEAVAEWLAATAPVVDKGVRAEIHPPVATRVAPLPQGLRETPMFFGPGQSLFGILTEPGHKRQAPDREARSRTAVLMLNVGGNHRVGPNRFYVRMARELAAQGWRAFRLDLAGLGDSRASVSQERRNYFSDEAVADVKAAIDRLAAEGCRRFWVLGICSGAYVAFQSALNDTRVSGQMLLNSRLLERGTDGSEDAWQATMNSHYKSAAFYWRSLLRWQTWWRLLRNDVNVVGIARRMGSLVKARATRALQRITGTAQETVLSGVKRLGKRGTETFVLMAAEDDGRDYVEFHFGVNGSRLRHDKHFRMTIVERCDHTFSTGASQEKVIGEVLQVLSSRA
jgi:alpha-beta hydrolase superfamily lysophospholipase